MAWIGAYCVGNSIAMSVSAAIGVEGLAELVVNALLSVVLFAWIRQRGLVDHYGLCRSSVSASRFLWYIPLIVFVSHNTWFGLALNSPALDAACCVLAMLFVGFLEEVIFRGLLFVLIFYRGGSLIPCIIAHGANNATNVFANQAALTTENQVMLSLAVVVIVVAYALILLRTRPIRDSLFPSKWSPSAVLPSCGCLVDFAPIIKDCVTAGRTAQSA